MKVDRLVSIIMILLDKKRIGAKELAEMFEVSPRTIYRDIDAINMAGVPICSTSGVNGGFEIMQGYKLDQKCFSISDLSAILMGLSSLSNMIRGEELVNAVAKVKSFIPADQAKAIEMRTSQICVDLSPWMENRNTQPYLERIQVGMQESRLLTFGYTDHHSNQTIRTVEPYQLVLKNSHWYLQGYCRERGDFRLFRLSRIYDLQIKEDTFIPKEFPKPQLNFQDIYTKIQKNIKLRIHNSIIDRVLDYCPFEQFVKDGEDYYIVNYPFIENDYYYDMLPSFGKNCECIDPPHIRAELQRRICEMAALYE